MNCNYAVTIFGSQVVCRVPRNPVVVIVDGCYFRERVWKRHKRVPMNSTLGERCRWRLVACKRFGNLVNHVQRTAAGKSLQRVSRVNLVFGDRVGGCDDSVVKGVGGMAIRLTRALERSRCEVRSPRRTSFLAKAQAPLCCGTWLWFSSP